MSIFLHQITRAINCMSLRTFWTLQSAPVKTPGVLVVATASLLAGLSAGGGEGQSVDLSQELLGDGQFSKFPIRLGNHYVHL